MRYCSPALILFAINPSLTSGEEPRPTAASAKAAVVSHKQKARKKLLKRKNVQHLQYSTVPISGPPSEFPILGPLTSADSEQAHVPPGDDEVMRAWERSKSSTNSGPVRLEIQRRNVRIVKEKIADYIDPPREVPLIGPVQLHHSHYKCTIFYTKVLAAGRPKTDVEMDEDGQDVVYIDYNHFHLMPESAIAAGLKATLR